MIHPLIIVIIIISRLIGNIQCLEKAPLQLVVKCLLLHTLFLRKQVCHTAVNGMIDKTSLYLFITAFFQKIFPQF